MKNLLIYINPSKQFGIEEKITAKIQIDNSLNLGWKKEDIILVTNFPYEYNGIKAIIVGDENFCDFNPNGITKINTIIDLHKKNLLKKDEIYWFHDFDVFQNEVISEQEIKTELGDADLGLTDKGRMPRWNGGSLFFKDTAIDIFEKARELSTIYKKTEELSLMVLYTNNLLWITEPEPEVAIKENIVPANISGMQNTNKRIKKINITYNFRMWNIRSTIKIAIKPIRAVQFHPFADILYNPPINELHFFMYGKNKINTVLMSEQLIKIFHKHGIK